MACSLSHEVERAYTMLKLMNFLMSGAGSFIAVLLFFDAFCVFYFVCLGNSSDRDTDQNEAFDPSFVILFVMRSFLDPSDA